MKETYKKQGYTITERTDLFDEEYGITPHLSGQLASLYAASQDRNRSDQTMGQLQRLILEYPKCPILKNYLSIAYRTLGDIDKAREINERTIDQHPDYLYARINKAVNHLEKDEFAEILKVLGEDLCIKKLYPERTVFHINEISSFLGITILYYDAIGNKKKKGKLLRVCLYSPPISFFSINSRVLFFFFELYQLHQPCILILACGITILFQKTTESRIPSPYFWFPDLFFVTTWTLPKKS